MTIRSLCLAEDADRPTVQTFIGMRSAGIDVTVVCPANHPNYRILADAGVPLVEIPLLRNFDKEGTAKLRAELIPRQVPHPAYIP